MGTNFYSQARKLGEILDGTDMFVVPDYQRAYGWEDAKVEELWNDLMDNCKNVDHSYLLGSIVTIKKSKTDPAPDEIVDGQQRLVTLTLLFCALRDSLSKHEPGKDDDKADYDDLIKEINKSIKKDAEGPLIVLNNSDDDSVFASICARKDVPMQGEESNKRITANYEMLLDYTSSLCKQHFEGTFRTAIRNIRKLFDAIKYNTCFISVEINDKNYAHQIFQSLNSKGQKLNQSDLIKSLLLQIVQNDGTDSIKDRWNEIMSSISIKKNPDDFLYYSMLSRTCPKSQDGSDEVLKMKMYGVVKNKYKNSAGVDGYLQSLSKDSHIIEALNNPDVLRSKADCDLDFVYLFFGIQQINAKYFRRPIIAACREWGFSDKTKSLTDCLLKFFFMYRTISKSDIDQIKRIARDVTCLILSKRDLDEVLYTILKSERLGSTIDNLDQERFMNEFKKNINDLKRPVATYILYSLEKKLNDSQGTRANSYRYYVDHIFPSNPNDGWANRDELRDHKNRLGNLTLLNMRWNPSTQNRSFENKIGNGTRCYSNSDVELNKKHLVDYTQWGLKEIEDRENKLIEHARKVWDLSEYSRLARKPLDSGAKPA